MSLTFTDARGNQSITLVFVSATWGAVFVKYLAAGIDIPGIGLIPPMTATEFGIAVTSILAIWLGREWTEKRS